MRVYVFVLFVSTDSRSERIAVWILYWKIDNYMERNHESACESQVNQRTSTWMRFYMC